MSKVDLSSFQSAAKIEYGDYEVTIDGKDYLFLNALRLTKDARNALRTALSLASRAEDDDDFETVEAYRDAFRISAKTPADFEALDKAVGDDSIVWSKLFADFATETLAEKASPSES